MADDFRVQVAWFTSRKRKRLRRELGSDGEVALLSLWAYAAKRATDGDLSGMSNDDIADECGWESDPDRLISVLVDCRLLDGHVFSYSIHDWVEEQPWVASEAARSESAKMMAHRRWKGKVHNRTKWCDEQCALHADAMPSALPAAMPNDACASPGIAPVPIPNPIPNPNPTPCAPGFVSSVPELEVAFQELGVIVPPKTYSKAGRLFPIPDHEIAAAIAATRGKGKSNPIAYALGVIENMRRDAAEAEKLPPTKTPKLEGFWAVDYGPDEKTEVKETKPRPKSESEAALEKGDLPF